MKQIFLLGVLMVFSGLLRAQTASPDTMPRRRVEIGLNITNTLGNFVGSTNALTNDPYLLSVRFGSLLRRLRMGLNFSVKDRTDPDFGNFFKEKETVARFRAGYERVYPMSRRLAMYAGLDAVFEYRKTDISTFTGGGAAALHNRLWGFGGGPVLGMAWQVHPRVSLTTECSVYAIYRQGTQQVNAPPDFSKQTVRDFSWQPLLPTSLYVNFSF